MPLERRRWALSHPRTGSVALFAGRACLSWLTKLFTFGGATVFSYIGWYLGEPLGFFPAFLISGVASILGVYVGWKIAKRLE